MNSLKLFKPVAVDKPENPVKQVQAMPAMPVKET